MISKSSSQALFHIIGIVLGFAILGGVGFVVYYLINSVVLLAASNPTTATAFVTGAITIVASVSAVVLGRYFEKLKEVEGAFRERRLQAYERFVSKFAEITTPGGNESDDLVPFMKQLNKEILLWAGPSLLKIYSNFIRSTRGRQCRTNIL